MYKHSCNACDMYILLINIIIIMIIHYNNIINLQDVCTHIHTHRKGDLLWEWAHTIMDAKKSYNLSSANWRPRKTTDIIRPESKGARTKNADV